MIQTEIIQQALADGVLISVDGLENLELTGDEAAIDKWLPVIRENKVALLKELSPVKDASPSVCQNCPRLESVEIMGRMVAGCLYQAPEPYTDGWRRLPADMTKCLWN